jgi:leucyl aminopeptidase
MRLILLLLPIVGESLAAAIPGFYGSGNAEQVVLNGQTFDASPSTMVGFSLDLNEVRLVQMEGQPPVHMTELEKIKTKAKGIKFFDITDTPNLEDFSLLKTQETISYTPPKLHAQVNQVIQTLSTAGPRENLEKLSSFYTRYYRSEYGRQSQQWLLSKVNEITDENASPSLRPYITVEEFKHSWGQNTIIARINGSSHADNRIVIVGAHQDSINLWPFEGAPGADDDGSGTVTILESYRSILASGFVPDRPVEFHWYSAEEGGLLGSQAVALAYAAQGLKVYAMSQFDMTAWVKQGTKEEVGVIVDHVNDSLTKYNKLLVDTYLSIPYVETKCGYACSDHASWSKAGYPSIFTIESAFPNANHHNIHSSRDRIDISPEFSFDHMLEFSKLAVAFTMELSTL